jgi:hypothetical protein
MKFSKIIFLLGLVLITSAAQSQVLITLLLGDKLNAPGLDFGLEGGINWSEIRGMESSKFLSSFNLGFYFDIRMKDQLSLYTGLLVKSKMGLAKLSQDDLAFLQTDTYPEKGFYSQQISYFYVPILAKYAFKNHIYVEAGPQAGLMYKAWVEYQSDVEGKESRVREFNKDMISRLDAGVMGGVGFRLQKGEGMTIGIKYYYGFVDAYKDKAGTKNSGLFLKFNIPVGG